MPSDISATRDPGVSGRERPALGSSYSIAGAPTPKLTSTQRHTRDAILRADGPDDYEVVACPCGADGPDRLLSEVDRHGLPCRNVICSACGLVRLSPRWRDERYRRFYQSEYRALYNPSLSPKAEYAAQLARIPTTVERARWIENAARRFGLVQTPSLVELGAGAGWNLAVLPEGWTRVGYDVDDEYLAIGRSSFGVELRHGFVEEALEAVSGSDLVLLSHVLEHFLSPEAVLTSIAGRLRPGTLLLIEVPGVFRIHRTNLEVRSYLQNAHTFTYCAGTLHDACRRAGLELLEIDQSVRAACRAGSNGPAREGPARSALAEQTVRYLLRCDAGYRRYQRLRRLPGVGRAAAALWKRTYLASLGVLVPGHD